MLQYPYNLLAEAKGKCLLEYPLFLSRDIMAGLSYVLSMLPEEEQKLIQLHYQEEKSLAESAEILGLSTEQISGMKNKALRKIRYPSRWNYICYGIAGNLKKQEKNCYQKGYQAGYAAGLEHGAQKNGIEESENESEMELRRTPIEIMGLSARATNVLNGAGYRFVGELIFAKAGEIIKIRGMGQRTADEIARALRKLDVAHTDWYQFLL